jgi:trehalose 6-phosphate phosphatase
LECLDERARARLERAERMWLFLDYDGTLAGFAPTPDVITVDMALVDLLDRLARQPAIRLAVISGRRLNHIRQLLPVPGVLLAGTYGIELLLFSGESLLRTDLASDRPALEAARRELERLIAGRDGFYLEDKGASLALHARFALQEEADEVLAEARRVLEQYCAEHFDPDGKTGPHSFRLLGGHKFLELCPAAGNKGETVKYLLEAFPWPGALPVYVGDDDKDEAAFRVIAARQGIAIRVGPRLEGSAARCRLDNPDAVRQWLHSLLGFLERKSKRWNDWTVKK